MTNESCYSHVWRDVADESTRPQRVVPVVGNPCLVEDLTSLEYVRLMAIGGTYVCKTYRSQVTIEDAPGESAMACREVSSLER